MVLVDLHSAAASADLARLRQHWWLNKRRINGYNRDKETPLHLACVNGHADVVQFLVEKKCKLNPCDKLDKSPLMKAVEHQHRDCAAVLLEHGANQDHRSINGNTALHLAVMVSSKSLAELLLEHGADIDAKNKWGCTPLTLAVTENREEMVKFLLQKGADVNAQDKVFRTPLQIATFSGNEKIIQLLLQHGADFSESDKELKPCQPFTNMVQDDVIANEKIGSSCYGTIPVIPSETPALAESCGVPKEEATEKKDNGPAADQNKVSVGSVRVQPYRGNYKGEGAEKKEDKHALCNPETDPKGRRKARGRARLPAAASTRSRVRSAAGERGKGVLPGAASVEAEKEGGDSSWGSEKKCLPAGSVLLQAVEERVRALLRRSAAEGSYNQQEDPETMTILGILRLSLKVKARHRLRSSFLLPTATGRVCALLQWNLAKTDSEGRRKASANVQLPAADQNRVGVRSAAVKRGKAARAEQKEHFMSSSENKLPTLQGEDLQLKVDSSTQTNSEQDKQPLARQKLDKILKKDSLEGAPLGTVKINSRKEQNLLLEKLERCKTRLKDLKEPLNRNEYYADSGKNSQKEKVITILKNMQDILVASFDSSAAAIPQLEERIQWLQMQTVRLEATIQQQAKIIEVFETIQQSLTSDSSVDTSLWHCDFPHAIKNSFGVKCAK